MKHEILRALHVKFGRKPYAYLRDFSFSFRTGEIVCFWGNELSAMLALKALLSGCAVLEQGSLFQKGHPCGKPQLFESVFIADGSTLVDSLSIYENIFVLRKGRHKSAFRLYRKQASMREAAELFRQVDSHADVSRRVKELLPFRRILISMMQAAVSDVPLVVVDLTSLSFGAEDISLFRSYLRFLRQTGKGLVLLISRASEILNFCDRAVLLANGRVQKVFWNDDAIDAVALKKAVAHQEQSEQRAELLEKSPELGACSQICLQILDSADTPVCNIARGEVVGIWDHKWQAEYNAAVYMKELLKRNHLRARMESLKNPVVDFDEKKLKKQKIAVVSGDVLRQAFQNLSPIENFFMPIYPLIANPFGVIRKNRMHILWEDVTQKFGLPKGAEKMEELNLSQRMLLLWFQSCFSRADIILFESPESYLDISGLKKLWAFYQKQRSERKTYLLFSRDYEFLKGVCSTILVSHDGCYHGIQQPQE